MHQEGQAIGIDNFSVRKPNMIGYKTIDDMFTGNLGMCGLTQGGTVIQVKADGEGQIIDFCKDAVLINRSGKTRWDLPCTRELEEALRKAGITSAELLGELHVWDWKECKPVRGMNVLLHAIRPYSTDLKDVRLGVWDVTRVNGKPFKGEGLGLGIYADKIAWLDKVFNGAGPHVYVLPWEMPQTIKDVKAFWKKHVWIEQEDRKGYEGIVIRNANGTINKLKPDLDMDGVIVGIKKTKTFLEDKSVQTVRVAIMPKPGEFIVCCDVASGITRSIGDALYKLPRATINGYNESKDIAYVQPMIVVKVAFTDVYRTVPNERLNWDGKGYTSLVPTQFVTLREPRFDVIRDDKKVTPREIGLEQLCMF